MSKEIFNKLKEENKKLESSFAEVIEKAKADITADDKTKDIVSMIYNLADYIHQRINESNKMIYACMDDLYEHESDSHVPKLPAGAMEKFLKTVGLDQNYDVKKTPLYCEASLERHSFEVEIKNKKT